MRDLLAIALAHMDRAESIVLRQEDFLARAHSAGWNTDLPEQLLAGGRALLKTFQADYSLRLEINSVIERSRDLVSEALAASRALQWPHQSAKAAAPVPTWLFLWSTRYRRWAWRSDHSYTDVRFIDLDEATADAALHGFDQLAVYWTATRDGRTTHYLPGRAPVNRASSEELAPE